MLKVDKVKLDSVLKDQIDFSVPPVQFVEILVNTLCRYGNLVDGRDALQAVLEATKKYLGVERQVYCDLLIQERGELIKKQGAKNRE